MLVCRADLGMECVMTAPVTKQSTSGGLFQLNEAMALCRAGRFQPTYWAGPWLWVAESSVSLG